jgi:hypothetical protein
MGDGLGYSIQLTYSKLDSSDINFTLITHSAASYLPSNPGNFYWLLFDQLSNAIKHCINAQNNWQTFMTNLRWYLQDYYDHS